jgi:5-methylcytosine-specific restriction endonuclease McrA
MPRLPFRRVVVAEPHRSFPEKIQRLALRRQRYKCASCETPIHDILNYAISSHEYGEGAKGHHVIPHGMGGPLTVENCVVICQSCHYSVHVGGHWANTTPYDGIKHKPMADMIAIASRWYPHYNG